MRQRSKVRDSAAMAMDETDVGRNHEDSRKQSSLQSPLVTERKTKALSISVTRSLF